MFEISGKYGNAKVFIQDQSKLEESARTQIQALMDNPYAEGSQVRIMPDCHAGKGCVIGFTQTLAKDSVVPSLVGCDIGCGMLAFKLRGIEFDERGLGMLDHACHRAIKSGFDIWDKPDMFATWAELDKMIAPVDVDKAARSIGSLGSGNHFVELNRASDGDYWLVVHTGSRHLGLETEAWYTAKADQDGAVHGKDFEDYVHDMRIVQDFAHWNRMAIIRLIFDALKVARMNIVDDIETIHNYIDLDSMTVRKGAIRLNKDERAVIPMNMADGSLIVRGKGNPDWNFSGPHGAGRLMSRGAARKTLTMEGFQQSMQGVYSTTVCEDTIDESKAAYKPMEDIIAAIGDTCEVLEIVKPVYNFKAAEKRRR
jgi:RNA-splicing ligase RtcB